VQLATRTRHLLGLAVILAVGAAVYLPAVGAGFVFDDHELIENGRLLRGPLSAIWFGATAQDYWPVTTTALWVEWRLFGLDPTGYHIVNVALHLVTALLLWRTLDRLELPGGWLAGLLFAVHPVTVESVAWVSEIKNTLSGALWLATTLAWLRSEEDSSPRWYGAALALFAMALLAKASVVVLPVILLGLSLARHGRLDRRRLLALSPFFALALIAGVGTVWFQHQNAMASGWAPPRGMAERVGGAGWAFGAYLVDAFLPVRLALIRAPWPVAPTSPWFWAPLAVLGVALAALWRFRSGWAGPLLLALGYHALCVAPVLGFVDMAFFQLAPVSNHLQYLALMGPVALAGWAGARLASRRPRVAAVVGAAVVGWLGVVTFQRASAFSDDLALWQAAVRDAPASAVARLELGHLLISDGRLAEGAAELKRAQELSPDPGFKHGVRSTLYSLAGKPADAAEEARRVLDTTEAPGLQSDAAWTLLEAGHADEAIAVLQRLTRRMPGSSEYAYRLSVALARAGRTAEAAEVLMAFCRARPGHPRMEQSLALLLVRLGQVDRARAHAAEVLGVAPSDPRAEAQVRAWYQEATR
jgi:protein O-mannosyl-transferase